MESTSIPKAVVNATVSAVAAKPIAAPKIGGNNSFWAAYELEPIL